ncbi:MAG: GntR family transcriptional regulator [Caldilineaceae bacterium]
MLSTSLLAASSRQRIDPESLNGIAYRQIKAKIIGLDLPPASIIDESSLAEELGIGLTPVRQALRRLAYENMVIILPRRGTIVADLNLADLHKIFEMRLELETLAVQLAARRITTEQLKALDELSAQGVSMSECSDNQLLLQLDHQMHLLLAQAAHNEFLAETMEWLYNHVLRLWNVSLHRVTGLAEAMHEHRQIYAAIRDQQEEVAAALMRTHVQHFQQAFLNL